MLFPHLLHNGHTTTSVDVIGVRKTAPPMAVFKGNVE